MSGDRSMSMQGPDLEAALRDLGAALVMPSGADIATGVRARIEAEEPRRAGAPWWLPIRARERGRDGATGRPLRRSLLLAAAALLLAAAAVTAAVGFGLPGIRILFGPLPSPVATGVATGAATPAPGAPGALLALGSPLALDEAADLIDFPIRLPPDPAIGPPDAVYLVGRRLTFVWAPGPGLPGTADQGVGLLLVELHASIDEEMIQKNIFAGTSVEAITVDGARGYWISGERHVLAYSDPDGGRIEDSIRVIGNTLLWTADGITYRLEGEFERGDAIELAESLR